MDNIVYYLAIGAGIAFFLLAILFVAPAGKNKLTIWHGVAFGAVAVFIAVCAQNYLQLFDWIFAGLMFYDIGAALFAYGMMAMLGVMIYNFVVTKGKHLVQ